MSSSVRAFVAVSLAAGTVLGAGTVIALEATVFKSPPRVAPEPVAQTAPESDDDALEAANASLVRSLAECNRRLRDAGEKSAVVAVPAPVASEEGRRGRRADRDRERTSPSKEDWERYAEAGTVPYRIPCVRDTPFTPTARDIERLGLSPDDAVAVRDAYAASNKRVAEQVTPLCASVVGGAEAATRIGPAACMRAIEDAARRDDPAKLKESLSHVAELNAGKRPTLATDASAAEKLFAGLTAEGKAFEADLAKRLGPEDAARIAGSRGLCQDRGVAAASQEPRQGARARRPNATD